MKKKNVLFRQREAWMRRVMKSNHRNHDLPPSVAKHLDREYHKMMNRV